jgi:hypothetical protein
LGNDAPSDAGLSQFAEQSSGFLPATIEHRFTLKQSQFLHACQNSAALTRQIVSKAETPQITEEGFGYETATPLA